MLKIILLSLFSAIFLINIYSQEKGVKHYERKLTIDILPLPGDDYNSNKFSIPFPDSLYEFALINIKKLKLPGTKAKAKLNTENKEYVLVEYVVKKGRKNRTFLEHFERKTDTTLNSKPKQCIEYKGKKIKVSHFKVGRKYTYKFEFEDC